MFNAINYAKTVAKHFRTIAHGLKIDRIIACNNTCKNVLGRRRLVAVGVSSKM